MAALRLRDGEEPLNECGAKYVRTYVILRGMHKAFVGAYIDADESHLGTGWRYFKNTRPAWWRGETPETHHYLMKSRVIIFLRKPILPGCVKNLIGALQSFSINVDYGSCRRHLHCVADLEDAVEKRIFTVEQLIIICTRRGASMRKVRSFRWC